MATWISIMSERSVPHLQKGALSFLLRALLIHVDLWSSVASCEMDPLHHSKSFFFCVLVFQKYKSYSPYDMQESIVKEVKGDLQTSFLVLGTL